MALLEYQIGLSSALVKYAAIRIFEAQMVPPARDARGGHHLCFENRGVCRHGGSLPRLLKTDALRRRVQRAPREHFEASMVAAARLGAPQTPC